MNQRRFPLVLAAMAVAALWTLLVRNLSGYWAGIPQYSFGWLAPAIGLYLLRARWLTRPAPAVADGWWAKACVLGALCALVPTWLVEQPNPDWRLISWALATETLAVTLGTVYLLGGLAWLRHFAFPFVFFLTAVPWPFGFESLLVQNLMRGVAAVTVELLSGFGIACMQHGNLIEVRTGVLGVDEACSGVRSLQSTFMMALFVGELYRFGAQRRFFLVGVGVALALVCNVARAFLLAWVASRDGLAAVGRWHDPAGIVILAVCVVALWAIALRRRSPRTEPEAPASGGKANEIPAGFAFAEAFLILLAVGGSEAWYRAHEAPEKIRWSVVWPETQPSFRYLPINETVRAQLGFSEGRAATWNGPAGQSWAGFFFRWNPGPSRAMLGPRSHNPEICLTGSGFSMEADCGSAVFSAGKLQIPFRVYRFRRQGHTVHVFFCPWQDHPADAYEGSIDGWSRLAGLKFVARGERDVAQQVLELALIGDCSLEAANRAMEQQLPGLIVRVRGDYRETKRGPVSEGTRGEHDLEPLVNSLGSGSN